MDLTRHVEELRQHLAVVAEAGGEESRAVAERLGASLDAAFRVVLLEALSAAADEITRDLAPTAVEVRLRGREPEFVVTPPPGGSFADGPAGAPESPVAPPSSPAPDADEGGTARITLRLPEQLKARIEQAASRRGVSVNSWLVGAVTDAVDSSGTTRAVRSETHGGQHLSGWAR
jgi:hypothetical protein